MLSIYVTRCCVKLLEFTSCVVSCKVFCTIIIIVIYYNKCFPASFLNQRLLFFVPTLFRQPQHIWKNIKGTIKILQFVITFQCSPVDKRVVFCLHCNIFDHLLLFPPFVFTQLKRTPAWLLRSAKEVHCSVFTWHKGQVFTVVQHHFERAISNANALHLF